VRKKNALIFQLEYSNFPYPLSMHLDHIDLTAPFVPYQLILVDILESFLLRKVQEQDDCKSQSCNPHIEQV